MFVAGESGVGKTRLLRELERRAARPRRARAARRVPGLRRGRAGLRADRRGAARAGARPRAGGFADAGRARARRAGAARARAERRRGATGVRGHDRPGRRVRPGPPVRAAARAARPAGRRRRRSSSPSRTSTGPTARRSSSSPRCCAACATSASCSSARTAATSCTDAIRCARSWPRRSAARSCSASRSAPSRRPSSPSQVAGILGDAAEPGLVARLHARSEGNAFFAEELLAASDAAAGPLPSACATSSTCAWRPCPTTRAACCAWPPRPAGRLGHRLLAAVAGLPEPALSSRRCATAVAQHVLVHDGDGYAFRHALLQEAAYADLLPGERTALHLALAEALRDDPTLADGTAAAELAHHWRAAHRMPEALAAYVRAGLEAEQVFAFAEAGQHFERALEIWDLVEDAAERTAARLLDGRGPRGAEHAHRRRAPPRGHARAHGHRARRSAATTSSARRFARERVGALPVDRGRQRRRAGRLPRRGARPTARPADARAGARARGRGADPHAPRPRRGDARRRASARSTIARAVGRARLRGARAQQPSA